MKLKHLFMFLEPFFERGFREVLLMKVIVVKTQEEGALAAFEIFKRTHGEGAQVFGLATGSSPIGLYELLRNSDLDFSDRISVNLDEYVGLAPTDEHSYHYFMKEQLFDAKPFKHSYLPDGLAEDVDAEVVRYERILQENPVDLQLLGIGSNAHIGFNEPGTPFTQRTHKVHLTESTIEANKRFFEKEEDVPRYAYSMGLQSIMDAKEIVLIAFGPKKIHAIKGLVEGPITEEVPASILQKHPKVTVICDEAAAELLTK